MKKNNIRGDEPTTHASNGQSQPTVVDRGTRVDYQDEPPREADQNTTASSQDEPPREDPFNLARLRLSQDFQSDAGVTKVLMTVPVRKPDKHWFVRISPDPSYRLETYVLELKEERETYLIDRSLWAELVDEIVPKLLLLAINRQGVVFILPVRLPGPDGRLDEWNRSLLQACELAQKKWVRIQASLSLGAYEVAYASGQLPEPEWPNCSFEEILRKAFRDRYITSNEHPVLKRLRGEK
jgi:hypothetical protein